MYYKKFHGKNISALGFGGLRLHTETGNPNRIDRVEGQKVIDAAYATDIEAVFQRQQERCRTDYFDFYLLHGVDENYISAYMDEEKGYLRFLLEQREAGRIGHIGFSSHAAPETLARFLDWYDGFDMSLIQLNGAVPRGGGYGGV